MVCWKSSNNKIQRRTTIPEIGKESAWLKQDTGAYCWYNNDRNSGEIYGALYNWFAVNTHKLCPKGWHVPNDEEWEYLVNYVETHSQNAGQLVITFQKAWTRFITFLELYRIPHLSAIKNKTSIISNECCFRGFLF